MLILGQSNHCNVHASILSDIQTMQNTECIHTGIIWRNRICAPINVGCKQCNILGWIIPLNQIQLKRCLSYWSEARETSMVIHQVQQVIKTTQGSNSPIVYPSRIIKALPAPIRRSGAHIDVLMNPSLPNNRPRVNPRGHRHSQYHRPLHRGPRRNDLITPRCEQPYRCDSIIRHGKPACMGLREPRSPWPLSRHWVIFNNPY